MAKRFLFYKRKEDESSKPVELITFEYAKNNPNVEVMRREWWSGELRAKKTFEPFNGLKEKTISDVQPIYDGPGNEDITSQNITAFIEEPCIPAILTLHNLGIQTLYSCAHGGHDVIISIAKETLSEENKNILESLNLKYAFRGPALEIKVQSQDTVEEVSNKLLELCTPFVPQPVLYGQKSQTEYLNWYSKLRMEQITKSSNIDINYIKDHLNYLSEEFPEYITFNNEIYECNMPDYKFQKEVLDRNITQQHFDLQPHYCINGTVWASKELYNINEYNKKNNYKKTELGYKEDLRRINNIPLDLIENNEYSKEKK